MNDCKIDDTEEIYLIRKRGYYYRPNRAGYTAHLEEAGHYSKAEAMREAAVEPRHISAIRQCDALAFKQASQCA